MDVVAQYHQENISDKTHHRLFVFFLTKGQPVRYKGVQTKPEIR